MSRGRIAGSNEGNLFAVLGLEDPSERGPMASTTSLAQTLVIQQRQSCVYLHEQTLQLVIHDALAAERKRSASSTPPAAESSPDPTPLLSQSMKRKGQR